MSAKQPEPQRIYPGIEVFLETEQRESIAERFSATKQALSELPKVKAEHGKRALAAISHAEGLLNQLFDVKDQLSTSAAGTKKGKR